MKPSLTWHRANPTDTFPFAIVSAGGRQIGTITRIIGRGDHRCDGMWIGHGDDGAQTAPDAYPERVAADLVKTRWMIPPKSQRNW